MFIRFVQKGKVLGRPRKVVDKTKVRRLRNKGLSIRAIAAEMKVSKSVVQRIAAEAA